MSVPDQHGAGRVRLSRKSLDSAQQCVDESPLDMHSAKKRACRRESTMLTPPSTRGRRMADKLGLHAATKRHQHERRIRHARYRSDVSDDTAFWLDDMTLQSPSTSKRGAAASAIQREWSPPTLYRPPYASKPVRDTLHNPFVEGGPADVGFTGPNASHALKRAMDKPVREPDTTVFVFRGQRVVHKDGEDKYASRLYNTLSPPRPRFLFASTKPRSGMPYAVAERNALSDEDMPSPKETHGRNLFADEIGARTRRRPEYESREEREGGDADAYWMASDETRPVSFAPRPDLPPETRSLLARLDHIGWDQNT